MYMYNNHKMDMLPYMTLGYNQWLDIPEDKLQKIAEIGKLFRDSVILWVQINCFIRHSNWSFFIYLNVCIILHRIDDILDESVARDGVPVTHHVHGTKETMASACYGFNLAFRKSIELGHPQVLQYSEHWYNENSIHTVCTYFVKSI